MIRTRPGLTLAASVLIALAAALLVAPASWLMLVVPAGTPLAIVQAHGTVWQGEAMLAVGPAGARRTLPDPVRWQWQWRAVTLVVNHPWLAGPVRLQPAWNGARMSAQKMQLPASVLATVGAPLNTLEPTGELLLEWPALRLGGDLPQGPLLQAQWRNAACALSTTRPLGTYRATLSGADGRLELTLHTLSGPLMLEGKGSFGPRQAARFSGTAQAGADASPETRQSLQNLLATLGPAKNGTTTLQFP